MLANLDLLLTTVFCPADDLLPERAKNARRRFGYRDGPGSGDPNLRRLPSGSTYAPSTSP